MRFTPRPSRRRAITKSVRLSLPVGLLMASLGVGFGAPPPIKNLAQSTLGAQAKSWEPGVHVVPEHEPWKAIDGSNHTYWAVEAADLPADLGVEWPAAQAVSSVIVRYWDGKMVRGPAVARTQQWAQLQYWDQGQWKNITAQILGQETSCVRYVFSPLTTTRLRLLFTEPPDPESRRWPDRLGIYVCEFEAYRDVPFQVVSSPARLKRLRRNDQYYNEWASDNPYDVVGPLMIEPKQTRVFSDALTPTLMVAESRWAKTPCAVEQPRKEITELKNGFMRLDISTRGELKETRLTNLVTGEGVTTPNSKVFLVRTSKDSLTPANFKVLRADSSRSDAEVSRLRVDLTSEAVDLSLYYELRRQDHFYHKWLTLTNKGDSDLQVLDVAVSSLGLPRPFDLMAGPELTYPVSRLKEGGFFSCLETVYWDHQSDTLSYYPGITLAPGKTLESEKAVVGVYRNRGEQVEGFDRGVRDWVIEYHTQVSPLPKDWPDIYLEGWSAKFGVQEVLEQPEWAERFFATAQKMGVRTMDTYEPTNLALLMPRELQKRWVDLADGHNIATGWWNDFGSDYGWGFVAPYLTPYACKLSPEAEAYFEDIVRLVKTYNLRGFHWADFFNAWPCDKTEHGHLPGKYSIYAQGKRMIRFAQEMHEAAPGLMLGADSGLDNPQYGRYADSRHHGGGWDAEPSVEPDIHLDRLYADMNRAYLYGLAHETLLRPWYRLLNCVNHFGMESHLHDRAGYRYALLSALGLAAQLTFDDAPDDIPESEIRFTQHWENWAKTNKDYLKQGDKLFDRSIHFDDIRRGYDESLAGFAHIRSDRGYVFLMNPSPVEQIAELTLNLDASASENFAVKEVFPGGMTLQGPANGNYPQGGKLRVTVPAKQVRMLWIAPSSGGGRERNIQPEDARAAQWRRYVGEWAVASQAPDSVTLKAGFEFPSGGESYLSQSVPEAAWVKEPWAYEKAYLVVLLKDETEELNDNWVPDKLPIPREKGRSSAIESDLSVSSETGTMSALVNGVAKTLHPFKTRRRQNEGKTRCYFIDLGSETKPGQSNEVEVSLPIETGIVFSGAYLDLPDQMPPGESPGE